MKPKYKQFDYSTAEKLFDGIVDADDPVFQTPQFLNTQTGRQIVIFQSSTLRHGDYGVVVGWVMSKPRKLPEREMVSVNVKPLKKEEIQKYRRRFRTLLSGPIRFW